MRPDPSGPCHRGSEHIARPARTAYDIPRHHLNRCATCGAHEKANTSCSVSIDKASLRDDVPAFRAGDTVNVHVKVVEGTRSRVQVFKGVVIRRHGGGIGETFTVRKVSFGVGVERTFPLHTPIIDKIEVVTRGDVRRAKLYYLRDLRGKAAKIKEKRETTPAS